MTVAVRPKVTVTVSRHACGAVWLAVSSDGRPRPGWRYRADQQDMAAEAVDSFRRKGATILEDDVSARYRAKLSTGETRDFDAPPTSLAQAKAAACGLFEGGGVTVLGVLPYPTEATEVFFLDGATVLEEEA